MLKPLLKVTLAAFGFYATLHSSNIAAKTTPSKTVALKTAPLILTNPVNDSPLANTAYLIISDKSKNQQTRPLLTNEKGETHAVRVSKEPINLVQAEGLGKELVIYKIFNKSNQDNETNTKTPAAKGTPYVIFNDISNQALCGNVNNNGWTHAYFMDNSKNWEDVRWILLTQANQTCSQIRASLIALTGQNHDAFSNVYQNIDQNFVLTKKEKDAILYAYVDNITNDSSSDIKQSAFTQLLNQAQKTALSEKNASALNDIGYSLGFHHKAYQQGLSFINDSLSIQPKDCHTINSKGYLLMRMGKIKQAQTYFYDADTSCQAAMKTAQSNDDENQVIDTHTATDFNAAIAVNFAHLAESYALSNDAKLANEFITRALLLDSTNAEKEIFESVRVLKQKNMLTEPTLRLLSAYIEFIEAPRAKQ